jgi:flagellar export protein FliJ
MPFRFPLAAVLMVRENAEEREERALKKVQLETAHVSRQIEEVNAEIASAHDAREQSMRNPIPAFQLQAYLTQLELAAEKKKILLHHLQNLRLELDRQMKVYQACHRDREALSNMLEKQREAYNREQAREQQKQLDDMFMSRRHRN